MPERPKEGLWKINTSCVVRVLAVPNERIITGHFLSPRAQANLSQVGHLGDCKGQGCQKALINPYLPCHSQNPKQPETALNPVA